jgi:hypothetical protein
MNYKGKVVDTPVAPMTSTGKTVKDNVQCEYTKDTTTSDFFDEFTSESDGGSKKSSY